MNKRIAIVTGSSQGIGEAISGRLLAEGYFVVGLDVEYADERRAEGKEVSLALACDVTRREQVAKAVREIESLQDGVHALVNNAGIFRAGDFCSFPEDAWDALLSTNVTGPVNMCQAFYPLLRRARGASVLNIASTDGVVASAGQDCEIGVCHDVHYAVTKGALITLTRALAMAWAKDRIRVNAIAPTVTDTPMARDLLVNASKRAVLESHIPLRSLADPRDIAAAARFLLSSGARMITGHVLPVDGGYLCR